MNNKTIRIGIVAGEDSGDLLASNLIQEIKTTLPNVQFVGLAGPKMIAAGCIPLKTNIKTDVMGFHQVLIRIPMFLYLRYKLIKYFKKNKIHAFIGVDFTEFNLLLCAKLKKIGIKTIQYKGPSVWAWRAGRVKKIKKYIDLILTIFPFEQKFYEKANVNATYVGHILARTIPIEVDINKAKQKLDLPTDNKVIAILPGSRRQEIKVLASIFLKAAKICSEQVSDIVFISSQVSEEKASLFNEIKKENNIDLKIKTFIGKTHDVLAASDAVLVASGTATLEAMLFKTPMVVAYKVSKILAFALKRLLKVHFISLPNLLSNEQLVPELLQKDANPLQLSKSLIKALCDEEYNKVVKHKFTKLHLELIRDTPQLITKAILDLI